MPSIKKSQEVETEKIRADHEINYETHKGKLIKGLVLTKKRDQKDGYKLGDIMVRKLYKYDRKQLKRKITLY